MVLKGKGFFIWKVKDCENGEAQAIAGLARQANFSHVLVKIADGSRPYNVDAETGEDLLPPVVQALHAAGIQVWGWHYVYGYDPVGEAQVAIRQTNQLDLDGYVIDAEAEYKQAGKTEAARQFMSVLRYGLLRLPVALSSYRYPSYHPRLPWAAFLEKCDYNMPQVYWLRAHNPAEQLRRCVNEFHSMTPTRPIIPVGAAFREGLWSATPADVHEFLAAAQSLNLSAANFWEWTNCRRYLTGVWDAISNYAWSKEQAEDISVKFIEALNSRDVNKVMALYAPNAVHMTAQRTIQGETAIRGWYSSLFSQMLPGATFALTGYRGQSSSRYFTWTAQSSNGSVDNGSDTLGLSGGKIIYHYTSYSVSPGSTASKYARSLA